MCFCGVGLRAPWSRPGALPVYGVAVRGFLEQLSAVTGVYLRVAPWSPAAFYAGIL